MPLRPPVAVAVVGSYATCTVARPGVCVDVAVEMPAECFHQKAYINHRYHARYVTIAVFGAGTYSHRVELALKIAKNNPAALYHFCART